VCVLKNGSKYLGISFPRVELSNSNILSAATSCEVKFCFIKLLVKISNFYCSRGPIIGAPFSFCVAFV
jgi:hypothetical protein